MPFMAATLGGKLGSGLLVAGFFAEAALVAVCFAVLGFAFGVAFFATGFLVVAFLIAIFFSP
jgi:hypothetical protein